MNDLIADRRLWLTVDRDQVVEEGDVRARFLLAGVRGVIPVAEAERLKLKSTGGRVIYRDGPELAELQGQEAGEAAVQKEEAGEAATGKTLKFGGDKAVEAADDSDRNNPVPEWPGRTSPETYLRLYPTGPKAELAAAVIAAKDDGAGGAT